MDWNSLFLAQRILWNHTFFNKDPIFNLLDFLKEKLWSSEMNLGRLFIWEMRGSCLRIETDCRGSHGPGEKWSAHIDINNKGTLAPRGPQVLLPRAARPASPTPAVTEQRASCGFQPGLFTRGPDSEAHPPRCPVTVTRSLGATTPTVDFIVPLKQFSFSSFLLFLLIIGTYPQIKPCT